MYFCIDIDTKEWKGYNKKSKAFNTLWFLENLKVITAGFDTKANPFLSLQEQCFTFITIQKGAMESDNEYLTIFNSLCKSLELDGGAHIFAGLIYYKRA